MLPVFVQPPSVVAESPVKNPASVSSLPVPGVMPFSSSSTGAVLAAHSSADSSTGSDLAVDQFVTLALLEDATCELNSEVEVGAESNEEDGNRHPMVTRSKNGIFKQRVYAVELSQVLSKDIHEAVTIPSWRKAVNDELQALVRNETWELVPAPDDQNLVGCKWLFKNKTNSDRSIARNKVRLVAQGFSQAAGTNYHETFSPLVKANTIWTVFALVVSQKWKIR